MNIIPLIIFIALLFAALSLLERHDRNVAIRRAAENRTRLAAENARYSGPHDRAA